MNRTRLFHVALVVALCLAIAGTALAAARKGKTYNGTTGQTDPRTSTKFTLKFKVLNGTVSKVDTSTLDTCPDGSSLRVHQNAFKSAPIDAKGRFVLRAGTTQQPAVMKGKIVGKTASGTLTDKSFSVGSGLCKAKTKWTATRK